MRGHVTELRVGSDILVLARADGMARLQTALYRLLGSPEQMQQLRAFLDREQLVPAQALYHRMSDQDVIAIVARQVAAGTLQAQVIPGVGVESQFAGTDGRAIDLDKPWQPKDSPKSSASVSAPKPKAPEPPKSSWLDDAKDAAA